MCLPWVARGEGDARRCVRDMRGTAYQTVRARRGVPAVGGTGCGDVLRRARGAMCLPWAARGAMILAQFLKNCM